MAISPINETNDPGSTYSPGHKFYNYLIATGETT